MAVCLSDWQNAIYLGHSWKVPSNASRSGPSDIGGGALGTPHFAAAASGGMRNAGMEWNGFWGLSFTTSAEPWHFNSSLPSLDYTLLA